MSDAWRLDGQRALVTGGTKGIGEAIVTELRQLGAEVISVARNGGDLSADVSAEAGRSLVLAEVGRRGGLDLLVNNVGTNVRKTTADFAADDLRHLIDTNLTSAWELTRALLPALRERRGSVVNVSSVAAVKVISTSTAAYAMTKAAMDQMTRFLAVEEGPHGVRVNAVQPWYVRTPLADQVLQDEAKRQRILAPTPMKRLGEPADVARAVAFLSMPAAGWITGVTLPIDGGFLAFGV